MKANWTAGLTPRLPCFLKRLEQKGCISSDLFLLGLHNKARYLFTKWRRDHTSQFGINFNNLLNIKCIILLHKIITSKQTTYLFIEIIFASSNRCKEIIQHELKTLLSQRLFFYTCHQFLEYFTKLYSKHKQCN